MKILILGAGKVGSSLASTLSRQGYEVSIVDLNKEKLLKLQEDFDLAHRNWACLTPNNA
jgi:trk system potassium uptake protein TrkA